ncbi:histidinol-phosphate transaminase [Pontimicrobium sp. SW4]|uniref:Histidinol-phosphate aminotransferase n=1 Tax=Pontimicrobium sp. SW4 TaxID=3153519 RepID=A0AAU7BWD0_9FLAO
MNIQDLIRDNVKALQPYSSARDEYKNATEDMVFLDANENPFSNGVNRYPDPQQNSVKDILAQQMGIEKEQILLGNGSDEVLDLIFRAFCNPNVDNIITLPPTYGMYEVLANINAIKVVKVDLSESFQPKVNDILESTNSSTKILFLCSPNNPTGNSFTTEEVEKLLTSFKGIVVIDEAYIDFSKQKSWLHRLEEFPNLIVTQTLSKAYGMAGIRLGICYASKEIITVLNKIKPPYNVNELTQQKALERISNPKEVSREIQKIIKQREWLNSKLKEISFVETIYPSEANFILVKVDEANKRYSELIERGIVIRNRTNQTGCNNCLRFTVGSQIENIKLITALKTLQ